MRMAVELWKNLYAANNVDFPGYPPLSHYIHSCNHPSGYVCSPLRENPSYSKLVMFVQTEMKGKLPPSIIEKFMPSNLVSFFHNAKRWAKAHRIPSICGCHIGHSSVYRNK
ncbi:LOW QUALITY PROTEIN: stAR-related lipid transfer protein 6 [Cricetulus griseus]|uniref:LOW QUALITY PROTEIN: stAR-related lipid transfer protein 6 n=1 Tax=Cricetulus griseus TaxID=10029 RepID=A0A9J7K3E3_CRIGR|nr:LOW QUALITY PROTEIN: stAR-related lipid transfer protein 6 [Cricetulus griseus]XP_035295961.1 LOW QUALITY PROTEIN: stAR-related lipid transfer protein 6 [Cricetulus griseus]